MSFFKQYCFHVDVVASFAEHFSLHHLQCGIKMHPAKQEDAIQFGDRRLLAIVFIFSEMVRGIYKVLKRSNKHHFNINWGV